MSSARRDAGGGLLVSGGFYPRGIACGIGTGSRADQGRVWWQRCLGNRLNLGRRHHPRLEHRHRRD